MSERRIDYTLYSLLDSPVEGIEGKDTKFAIETTVGTTLKEELNQFRDMLPKDGYFLHYCKQIPMRLSKI